MFGKSSGDLVYKADWDNCKNSAISFGIFPMVFMPMAWFIETSLETAGCLQLRILIHG